MAWWGKIIGGAFGLLIGGPLGALLGIALGHNFDRGLKQFPPHRGSWTYDPGPADHERIQTAFFTATFSVMGQICKVDGRVSRDEIAAARSIMAQMRLTEEQKRAAIALFNQGKARDFPLREVLAQLHAETRGRAALRRMFVEIQTAAGYADGALAPAERSLLHVICDALGVSRLEFQRIEEAIAGAHAHAKQRAAPGRRRMTRSEAYAILGVDPDTPPAEVTRAYRRLLSQNHPDKLVAKGLPEEMIEIATRKTREIREAYELLRQRT